MCSQNIPSQRRLDKHMHNCLITNPAYLWGQFENIEPNEVPYLNSHSKQSDLKALNH